MPLDTELHKAAHKGDLPGVQSLVETGEVGVNEPGAQDRTALHRAAGANHVNIIQYLLQAGAPVDCVDRCQRTPLHWSAISGRVDATQLLLESGADLRCTTISGMNPLMCAVHQGWLQVAETILDWAALGVDDNDGPSPEEMCTTVDAEGKTALALAKEGGDKQAIKLVKTYSRKPKSSSCCSAGGGAIEQNSAEESSPQQPAANNGTNGGGRREGEDTRREKRRQTHPQLRRRDTCSCLPFFRCCTSSTVSGTNETLEGRENSTATLPSNTADRTTVETPPREKSTEQEHATSSRHENESADRNGPEPTAHLYKDAAHTNSLGMSGVGGETPSVSSPSVGNSTSSPIVMPTPPATGAGKVLRACATDVVEIQSIEGPEGKDSEFGLKSMSPYQSAAAPASDSSVANVNSSPGAGGHVRIAVGAAPRSPRHLSSKQSGQPVGLDRITTVRKRRESGGEPPPGTMHERRLRRARGSDGVARSRRRGDKNTSARQEVETTTISQEMSRGETAIRESDTGLPPNLDALTASSRESTINPPISRQTKSAETTFAVQHDTK